MNRFKLNQPGDRCILMIDWVTADGKMAHDKLEIVLVGIAERKVKMRLYLDEMCLGETDEYELTYCPAFSTRSRITAAPELQVGASEQDQDLRFVPRGLDSDLENL